MSAAGRRCAGRCRTQRRSSRLLVIVGRFLVGRLIGGIVRRLIGGIARRLFGGVMVGIVVGPVGGLGGGSLVGRRGRRVPRAGGTHNADRGPRAVPLTAP